MKRLNKAKSRTQEVAEFMLKENKHYCVLDLANQLSMTLKDAHNTFYSIRKSGRYETEEKTIDGCNYMIVISVNNSKHGCKNNWHYTTQEKNERLSWDFAIFGIEPVRNKAFELGAQL